MKFLIAFIVLCYALIFAALGSIIIAFSLNLIYLQDIIRGYDFLMSSLEIRAIVGSVGFLLSLISIWIAQTLIGDTQKKRVIEFDNPAGKVSIELTAIEEFIKRVAAQMPAVKDLKVRVNIKKRSLETILRVSLWGALKVPETTEQLQEDIKRRLQSMLGIEEDIQVTVHIAKILRSKQDEAPQEIVSEDVRMPFPQYGE